MTSDQLLIDLQKLDFFFCREIATDKTGITLCVTGISLPFENSLQIMFVGLGYVKTLCFPVFNF